MHTCSTFPQRRALLSHFLHSQMFGNKKPYFSFIPQIDSGKHTGGLANVFFFSKGNTSLSAAHSTDDNYQRGNKRCPLSPCVRLI